MLIERTASMICGMPAPDDMSPSAVRQLMDGRDLEENFRRLFEKYYHAVSSFFFRKGLSSEDRRDLTQEVFVAVHQGIRNLRSEEAFLPWLFSIAIGLFTARACVFKEDQLAAYIIAICQMNLVAGQLQGQVQGAASLTFFA